MIGRTSAFGRKDAAEEVVERMWRSKRENKKWWKEKEAIDGSLKIVDGWKYDEGEVGYKEDGEYGVVRLSIIMMANNWISF